MIRETSEDTKAILLMTAPMICGRAQLSRELLRPAEYRGFAQRMHAAAAKPAELLGSNGRTLIGECGPPLDSDRLLRLLERGMLLGQALDHWLARAIWVISRADDEYPRRLKSQLRWDCPPLLYGCGDIGLLADHGLAVVGSRNVNEDIVQYTEGIGRLAASSNRPIVSGGARGVDQSAMRGSLKAGGCGVAVLPNNLERAAMSRQYRGPVMDNRLLLLSPYDPKARFFASSAMARNKVIYALGQASLVVHAVEGRGGTWEGATEHLARPRRGPVYVRSTGTLSPGLQALRDRGAWPWPSPIDADAFIAALNADPFDASSTGPPETLPFESPEDPGPKEQVIAAPTPQPTESWSDTAPSSDPTPADDLFDFVRKLALEMLASPKREQEIAAELGVSKPQARAWMSRLVKEGSVKKQARPVRYQRAANLLLPETNDRRESTGTPAAG